MPRPSPGQMRQTRKRSQYSARVGLRPGGPAAAGTWPWLRLPRAFKFVTRAGFRVIPLSHVSPTLLLARDLDGSSPVTPCVSGLTARAEWTVTSAVT